MELLKYILSILVLLRILILSSKCMLMQMVLIQESIIFLLTLVRILING